MSVLKQMHQALVNEQKRLKDYREDFGRRWNIRVDMRDLDDHNRICRKLVREHREVDLARTTDEVDTVVDVCHWKEVSK